ncbi:hypothetical protein LCGC14_2508140, partial [marine sediment metagenome]
MEIDPFQKLKDIWNNYKLKKGSKGSIDFPEFKNKVYDWNAKYCHYRSPNKISLQKRYDDKKLPLVQSNDIDFKGIVMIKQAFVSEGDKLFIFAIPIYDSNEEINITHGEHKSDKFHKEINFFITHPKYINIVNIEDAYKLLVKAPTIAEYYGVSILKNTPVYISYFNPFVFREPEKSIHSLILPNYDIFGTVSENVKSNNTIMTINVFMLGGLPQPRNTKISVPMWAHDNIWLLDDQEELTKYRVKLEEALTIFPILFKTLKRKQGNVLKIDELKFNKVIPLYFAGQAQEYDTWINDRAVVDGYTEEHEDHDANANAAASPPVDEDLIENFAGVIESVLRDLLSVATANIDEDSFNIASNDVPAASYKCATSLTERGPGQDFLFSLCRDCRSWLWWQTDGTIKMKVMEDTYAASN